MSADTMRRSAKRALLVLAACIAAAPAFAQRGAMTVPRNLDQLTDRASDIVRGTVVSARVEKHPELSNLDTVVVTLRVHDTLKGHAAGTYTFRQYIWDVRDRYDAAGYRKGQDLLLLMIAPSALRPLEPGRHGSGSIPHNARPPRETNLRSTAPATRRLFDGAESGCAQGRTSRSRQGKRASSPSTARGRSTLAELTALIRELAKGSE